MPNQQAQIDRMNFSTNDPDLYRMYLDEASSMIDRTFGKSTDTSLSPDPKRIKLREYIVDSMIEAEKADWFFSTTGRDEFRKNFGFDYPFISEFEQQSYDYQQKPVKPEDMDIREMDIEMLRSKKLEI